MADAVKNVSRNVPFSIRGDLPSRQHFKNNGVPIHCVAFLLKEADFQTTGHLLVMPVFVEIKEFDPKYCKAIWFLSLFSFLPKPQSKAKVTRLFTHFLTAISFAVVYISTYFKLCPRTNKDLIYHLLIFCFKFGDFHCQHSSNAPKNCKNVNCFAAGQLCPPSSDQ